MSGYKRGRKLEKYVKDYVVFDLETTGVSPVYDEVVEISGIRVADSRVVEEFTSLVNPGRHISDGASQVNGITDEMVADAPDFQEVLGKFLDFAGSSVLVGHNIHSFDLNFIYRDAEKYYGTVPGNDYVDTLSLARACLPELSRYRLTDLASYYGISSAGAHRALQDCYMNQQIFECLGKELQKGRKAAGGVRICPRCGQVMKRRNGKFGEFWGCSGYPACRHTENL